MPVSIEIAEDNATGDLKDLQPGSKVLVPGQAEAFVFGVSQQPVYLRAFDLVGADEIRVLMIAGDASNPLTAPFRPALTTPVSDTSLTTSRNILPILYPGRYTVERLVGAANATVYGFSGTLTHEAGNYYATVTGDSGISLVVEEENPNKTVKLDILNDGSLVQIGANVILSDEPFNLIVNQPDGIFAFGVRSLGALTSPNNTVDVLVMDDMDNNLTITAALIISPDAGNSIEARPNGVFVGASGIVQFLEEEVILISSVLYDVIDSDVETVAFAGTIAGSAPEMTFPTDEILWNPVNATGPNCTGGFELQISIASSSHAVPGTDSYLQVEVLDSDAGVTALWRIPNPNGDQAAGIYTLKWYGIFSGFPAGTNPGGEVRLTTTGDATFLDVVLQSMRIFVRKELL